MRSLIRPLVLTAFSTIVAAHGAIISAIGDKGGSGMAIGSTSIIPPVAYLD